jgi:hypothetical protein
MMSGKIDEAPVGPVAAKAHRGTPGGDANEDCERATRTLPPQPAARPDAVIK